MLEQNDAQLKFWVSQKRKMLNWKKAKKTNGTASDVQLLSNACAVMHLHRWGFLHATEVCTVVSKNNSLGFKHVKVAYTMDCLFHASAVFK